MVVCFVLYASISFYKLHILIVIFNVFHPEVIDTYIY